jgi:hypothetical protein
LHGHDLPRRARCTQVSSKIRYVGANPDRTGVPAFFLGSYRIVC